MFYLLVILGLVAMAAGVFVVGFGVPIRETVFGSGLLVAGSVAITGGFILMGLAAAVAELQRVVQALKARVPAVTRPLRPVDRKDGSDKRPGPPRVALPVRPGPDLQHPAQPHPMHQDSMQGDSMQGNPLQASPEPTPAGARPTERDAPVRKPGPEWLRRAVAEIEQSPAHPAPVPEQYRGDDGRSGPDDWPRPANPAPLMPPPFPQIASQAPHQNAPEPAPPESRAGRAPAPTIFDMVWPSDRRKSPEGAPEKHPEPEPPPRVAEPRFAPAAPPPPPPKPAPPPLVAPPRPEPRPQSILKSGVIDEMAYTLFTDGSIEAQMPDGTMRFASIDELRAHLEKHAG